jgi:hypothetical protein
VLRYDGGTTWTSAGQVFGTSNAIEALVSWNGSLYAGATGPLAGVARYDGGTTWTAITGFDDSATGTTLIVWNGSLHAGTNNGKLYRYNGGSSWISLGKAGAGTNVDALAVFNGSLYVVSTLSAPSNISFFRYNGTDGSNNNWTWLAQVPHIGLTIYSLAVYNSTLYAGGSSSGHVFRWNGTEWNLTTQLGAGGSFGTNVRGLAVWNGSLWAGTSMTIDAVSHVVMFRHGNGTSVRSTNKLWENVYQHVVVKEYEHFQFVFEWRAECLASFYRSFSSSL